MHPRGRFLSIGFVIGAVVVLLLARFVQSRGGLRIRERPALALVIDDFGNADETMIDAFVHLGIPFTAAVLPYQQFSRLSAEKVHGTGGEVIVHLPMEGREGHDPGPHALLDVLDEEEMRSRTRKALNDLPFVTGASNHMGSVLTQDTVRMRWILEEIRDRHLFFVDSRTTVGTVAEALAHRMGIPSVSRRVFLDDSKQLRDIEVQWNRAVHLAERSGSVLVIGHIYPETLEALANLVPRYGSHVRFVVASELAR
jgi:uncharacterized protein